MAVEFAVVNGLTRTTTGNSDYTSSGFGTPTGFIVILGNANTTNNPQTDARIGWGFSDLTTDCAVAVYDSDGAGTTNTGRSQSSSHCIYVRDSTTTYLAAAYSAPTTDGVTINYSTVNTGVARYISVILIKGTTNIKALAYALSTGTTYDINTISFQPDWLLVLSVGDATAPPTQGANSILSVGFAANNSGGVSQAWFGESSVDSEATASICSSTVRNDAVTGQQFNDAVSWYGSAGSFDSQGFTLTTNTNPGSDRIFILAIEADSQDDVSVDVVSSPTATGDWSLTDPGYTPNFGMLIQTMVATVNTVETDQDGGAGAYGAFDDTTEQAIGQVEQDAAGTSNTESYANQSNAIYLQKWGGSSFDQMYTGAFSSFDANGVTFNLSAENDSASRQWILTTFKAASAGGATGKSNPFRGPFGGPFAGPIT